ncbi:MAG: CPBP family intramembrane metalloprotease [Thermoguttaceae bacterium]|nr:CPBP family intramembrane metalloprotease [Thermoguttaceae bacterium]MDW8039161.1 CPBP family intramembrane glutamic endopeptidase [Thermoguttaceae bacterium]
MPPLAPGTILGITVAVEGGLGLVAVGVGWLVKEPIWGKIDWNFSDALVGGIVAVPLLVGLWVAVNYPWGPWRGLVRVLQNLVVPLFSRCGVWQLGLISILAGLGEEMFFRGLLQDGLARWLGQFGIFAQTASLWLAVGLASCLFGLLHWISPFYAFVAGLMGAYLGWWRIRSGNLLGPIIAHAFYDFVGLVYLTKWWRPR